MVGAYELQNTFWRLLMLIENNIHFFISLLFFENLTKDNRDIVFEGDVNCKAQINQAERILNEYGNSILRLAYSFLHNMSDAEDVLQDTLIQYIKTAPFFDTVSYEKAWLMRVAINISKNKISYNKIRKTDELSENLEASEKEDLAFVWDAVKKLPTKYREVVHLYYYEGYSTVQIAQMLSKKEATVRSLLKRGREKLKEILKVVYDFEE